MKKWTGNYSQEFNMNEEKLIHVKLDFADALESKKNVLEIERGFMQINNSIENFNALRMNELKMKIKLLGKIREVSQIIRGLKKFLPEPKMPKILMEEKHEAPKPVQQIQKMQKQMPVKRIIEHKSIDEQIRDIQSRLNSL